MLLQLLVESSSLDTHCFNFHLNTLILSNNIFVEKNVKGDGKRRLSYVCTEDWDGNIDKIDSKIWAWYENSIKNQQTIQSEMFIYVFIAWKAHVKAL